MRPQIRPLGRLRGADVLQILTHLRRTVRKCIACNETVCENPLRHDGKSGGIRKAGQRNVEALRAFGKCAESIDDFRELVYGTFQARKINRKTTKNLFFVVFLPFVTLVKGPSARLT